MHTCSVPEMGAYICLNAAPSLRHIIRWKPDVLHVHFAVPTGALGWTLSRMTRTPYVLTTQLGDVPGGVPDQTDHLFRLVKPFSAPIWRDASAVTVPSEHIREMALESYPVDMEIIPNGIDLETTPQSPPEPHHPVRLVFAGRFNPQKNLLFLLDALNRINDLDWEFSMLGDGPLMDEVRSKTADLGLTDRVRFYGWVDTGRVAEVMSESDALVLPSLSEGMPLVGAGALGAGLAIVASDVGGNTDVVTNGVNGFLCPVNHVASFEKALRAVITAPDLLSSMKHQSRRMAVDFDIRTIAKRFEELFRNSRFRRGTPLIR